MRIGMTKPPLFSVIVPTYHRNDLLSKCLDCLAPGVQKLPAEQYEVIVTDDGSQTTAQEMISDRYPWVKWVAAPHQGPATNRNNGSKYAEGEWLIFTDDDCLPDSQWLEAYSQAILNQPDCLVFEGKTYVDSPRKSLAETAPINETGGYLWSCNLAIQKQLFESLGGFDQRFPYAAMEDVDLRLRLTKLGYKFSFIPLASVCHPWRDKGGWEKLKQHNYSTLVFLSIHPEQIHKINFNYYIWYVLRSFLLNTIPGIFRYKMAGAKEACIEHLAFIKMAFILLLRFSKHQQLLFQNTFWI
jgi:GT2 family glycosyltransferase